MNNKVTAKRKSVIDRSRCVACGVCAKICRRNAIDIFKGIVAKVEEYKCVGCKLCEKVCPASAIKIVDRGGNQ